MSQGLKMVVRGTIDNAIEWRNIFYCKTDSDFNDTTIRQWVAALYEPLYDYISNKVHIYGTDVATRINPIDERDTKGWGASTFCPSDWSGNNPGEMLPPADTMLVLGLTGVKHAIGRKSIPGLVESYQSAGVLLPGLVSALETFSELWLAPETPPVPGSFTMCIWGPGHGFTPLVSARVNNKVFHLDRRQYGRGV